MKSLKYFSIGLLATVLFGCSPEETTDNPAPSMTYGEAHLEFEHFFANAQFQLGGTYTNSSGESVTINTLRYYISNIQLEKMDGTVWAEKESYHLVDVSESGSLMIDLDSIPTGEYHHLTFTIGVDSARNVSGAQSGALSPSKDMFWTWNTGYIFFKVEGTSPQAPNNNFTYHVGGFAGEHAAQIKKQIHFMQALQVNPTASPTLHFEHDLALFFNGMHTLSVANTPTVMMPGMLAAHLAHNFGVALQLDHVHE